MGRFSLPERAPQGLNSPVTTAALKYMAKAQVWLFRKTNGRIGNRWRVGAGFRQPVPTLLLEHTGRKSGKTFTTPLLYMEDGDDIVVVASQGGMAENPQWYRNLRATPETRVHLEGRPNIAVTAHVADPEQRAELWPRLVELYADFATYQKWTDREIPVVVLTPA